jgi:ribosomal protein S18 acetylase RimI-like enzyme
MSQGIVIRKATQKDLDELLALSTRLIKFDQQFDSTMDVSWPRSSAGRVFFTKRLESDDGLVLMAELDKVAVGYLIGGKVPAEEFRTLSFLAELEEMFVDENYRGYAIGAKLWTEFLNWCRLHKLPRITVSVAVRNQHAIDFYKKMGFDEYCLSFEREI